MRIVLALKDTDLRLAIELLLSEEPGVIIVGSASDTQGLLALIEASCPDLALLDWDLPGKPILEVLANIQARDTSPEIVVLGIDPDFEDDALNAGANVYLFKGDQPERLLSVFRQVRLSQDLNHQNQEKEEFKL